MYIAMLMTGWGSQAGEAKVGGVCGGASAWLGASLAGSGGQPACMHAHSAAWLRLGCCQTTAHNSPPLCRLACPSPPLPRCRLLPSLPPCCPQYLINVGWTSVWVKVVSQWVTVGLYCWTLVAPLLFPDRDFN